MSDSGTCFLIKATPDGKVTYGKTGKDCVGKLAFEAAGDKAW